MKFFLILSLFTLFFTFFPSFSGEEQKKLEKKKINPAKFSLTESIKSFSFEPSPLMEEIFKKPRTYYLKGKKEQAYISLKKIEESMIYEKILKKNRPPFLKRLFSKPKKKQISKKENLINTYEKIKQLRNYALGVWSFELNRWDEAIHYLTLNLKGSKTNDLKPFLYHYIGISYFKKGDLNQGEKALRQVFFYPAFKNRSLIRKSQFFLGQIALKKEKWREALKHFKKLEKKWRQNAKHPEVLWHLMKIAKKRKKMHSMCRWARKIYSFYPNHPLIFNWNFDLKTSLFQREALNCLVDYKNLKRRILNLQRFGESKRAESEIKQMKEKIKIEKKMSLTLNNHNQYNTESFLKVKSRKGRRWNQKYYQSKRNRKSNYKRRGLMRANRIQKMESRFKNREYKIDSLYALFLIYEGFPQKAFDLLYPYFNQKKNDFDYLKLFGKASRESENYQLAVSAYYKNSKINPKTKSNEQSLFYSGFLSFRFKDYDFAYKAFEEFKERYRKSHLYPQAFWYSAWIQYLKGNHSKAITLFHKILSLKEKEEDSFDRISDAKIKYWIGMSYAKLNQPNEARAYFLKLLSDRLLNYYTIASYYRLKDMNSLIEKSSIENILYRENLNPFTDQNPSEWLILKENEENLVFKLEKENQENSEADEEREILISHQHENEEREVEKKNKNQKPRNHFSKAEVSALDWKLMREKFERIKNFISIGAFHWAKWNLYEIELQAKEKIYQRLLIKAYKKIQSFHRSSYISVVHFNQEKKTLGLSDGKLLWKNSFPQAYFKIVKDQSNKLKISKNLIWAIMRTESNYKQNTISPVGAKGLMQVMPYTAYKVREKLLNRPNTYNKDLIDPETNIEIGVRYVKHLLKTFNHQMPLAIAAYNAGPHRVKKWMSSFNPLDMDEFIEHIPFIETRNYVKKVMRNYKIYQYLYEDKKNYMNWFIQPIAMLSSEEIQKREKASLDF